MFYHNAEPLRLKNPTNTLISNQYTLPVFYSLRFSHSYYGPVPVRPMPTTEHCWKKNSGIQRARTSNLFIIVPAVYHLSCVTWI